MSAAVKMPIVFEAQEEELIAVSSFNLTGEEQEECESFLRSVIRTGDCGQAMRSPLAGSFKRGVVSACMMGRARRFLLQAAYSVADNKPVDWGRANWITFYEPDWARMAYRAASKACEIFPVSINFYDFGCLLQEQGRHGKARMAFKEFLRRVSVSEIDPVARAAVSRRNLDGAIEHARQSL
ncbi:MAG: hypothetical protein WBQ94_15655 [Terracidiphilus sp.]